jgi:hypothetical protein
LLEILTFGSQDHKKFSKLEMISKYQKKKSNYIFEGNLNFNNSFF